MSIWGNNINPVGYAAQNQTGPGISLDPRILLANEGNKASRARTSTPKAASDDKMEELLPGHTKALYDYRNQITNRINMLPSIYTEKIKNESDPEKLKQYETAYDAELQDLFQKKSQFGVAEQQAKFAKSQWEGLNTEINKKGIGQEIAVTNPNLGKAQSAEDFLQLDRPFALDFSKTPSGRNAVKLHSYNTLQERNSWDAGITPDGTGGIAPSHTLDPSLKMMNSLDFSKEIKGRIDAASAKQMAYAGNKDDGLRSWDWSRSDNYNNMKSAASSMWQNLPEDARAYAMSSALNGTLIVPTGTTSVAKDAKGRPITKNDYTRASGEQVVASIELLKQQAKRIPTSDVEARDKNLAEQKRLADAIMTEAQRYVYATAANDTKGLRDFNSSNKSGISELLKHDEAEDKNAISAIDIIYSKPTNPTTGSFFTENPKDGMLNFNNPTVYSSKITGDERKVLENSLFPELGVQGKTEKVTNLPMAMFNGIAFKPDVVFGDDKNAQIMGINSDLIKTIRFDKTPKDQGGYLLSRIQTDANGQPIVQNYVTTMVRATGDTKLPFAVDGKNPVLTPISQLAKNPKNHIKKVSDAPGFGFGFGEDIYEVPLQAEGPSTAAQEGRNAINKYNINKQKEAMAEGNLIAGGESVMNNAQRETNLARTRNLQNKYSKNGFIDDQVTNKVYVGKTPQARLVDIQAKNNIDFKSDPQRSYMKSLNIINNLETSGKLQPGEKEQYINMLDKQKQEQSNPNDNYNFGSRQSIQ